MLVENPPAEILKKLVFRNELAVIYDCREQRIVKLCYLFEQENKLTMYKVKTTRGRYGYKHGCIESEFKECYENRSRKKQAYEGWLTITEIERMFNIQYAKVIEITKSLNIPFKYKNKKIMMWDKELVEKNSESFIPKTRRKTLKTEKGIKEKINKNWLAEIYDLTCPYTRMFLNYNN